MKSLTISGKKLTNFILYFTIIMNFLIDIMKLPSSITYINDFCIILILLISRFKILKKTNNKEYIIVAILMYFLISIMTSIINFVPIRLVVYAIRNTFRGIIYFFAVIYYYDLNDIKKIFDNLFWFQVINFILALLEFFILHTDQDSTNGIFGIGANGGNAICFSTLISAYYINYYLKNKEGKTLAKLLIVLFTTIVHAAIGEQKIYFFNLAIFIIASIIILKFSIKKAVLSLFLIGVLFLGLIIIKKVYPTMYETMIDLNKLLLYSETIYESGYGIPRIGAFKFINKKIFDNDKKRELIGMGFGNCEYSSMPIFCSNFYKIYGDYNYRWFTHQWIYLEEGMIGFISFVMIFITIMCTLFYRFIKTKNEFEKTLILTSIYIGVYCIISIWYNSTLKTDCQYLFYFGLALGFIKSKSIIKKKSRKEETND